MFKLARPFFLQVISSLHAGSGDDIGIVDRPIQRERHTGFPKIESSSLKGAIRQDFEDRLEDDRQNINLVFGPDKGESHAGALGFTDARVLLFPVKSMEGVFHYITCPMILKKFQENLELCKIFPFECNIPPNNILMTVGNDTGKCLAFKTLDRSNHRNHVILEEYCFQIEPSVCNLDTDKWISSTVDELSKFIEVSDLRKKLVILSDDDFKDFVTLATEVITRIKIDPLTGVVVPGALFTEEYLPPETILYSLALASRIFNQNKGSFNKNETGKSEEERVMRYFQDKAHSIIQIGGNSSIGKGLTRISFPKNAAQEITNGGTSENGH